MPVSFKTTKEETKVVDKIVARAKKLYTKLRVPFDGLSISMDLCATHANGCPLDFEKLLGFPDQDFAHDIGGISRHLDRKTGHLRGHFLPRCAKPQTQNITELAEFFPDA